MCQLPQKSARWQPALERIGVAKNQGIIQALEEKLGAKLYICDEAQLCGALGAALFAYEKCKGSAEETR